MKKFLTQILLSIGFGISLLGIVINNGIIAKTAFSSICFIGTALAVVFVFSDNKIVKGTGYSISACAGASGIVTLLDLFESGFVLNFNSYDAIAHIGTIIYSIGLIIMLLSVIFQIFVWCGFTRTAGDVCKNKKADSGVNDITAELYQYKALEKEGILSSEEFESLKSKALKNGDATIASVDDLKKWKKLLDQQVISQEEFTIIKTNLFKTTT